MYDILTNSFCDLTIRIGICSTILGTTSPRCDDSFNHHFFFLFCPGISVAAVEIRHRKEIKSEIIITHFLIFCINYYQSNLFCLLVIANCNFSYSEIIFYYLIDKESFILIMENLIWTRFKHQQFEFNILHLKFQSNFLLKSLLLLNNLHFINLESLLCCY